MNRFEYKAINSAGVIRRGFLLAQHEDEVELKLKKLGLEMIRARQMKSSGQKVVKLTRPESINFFFSLSQSTRAGIPLFEAIADLADTLDPGGPKMLAMELRELIETGKSLSEAFEQYPHLFSVVVVSLIKAGEVTGRLPDILEEITAMKKWEDELASNFKKATLYPIISLTLVGGAMVFLLIWLVPQLATFIKDISGSLPMQTQVLLNISLFLKGQWYWLLGGMALTGIVLHQLAMHVPRVRVMLHAASLRIPIFGSLLQKLYLSKYCGTLAMMYSSGVSIVESLHVCANITSNQVMQTALRQTIGNIEDGASISDGFLQTGFFPSMVIRLINVGEKTGNLDDALQNVKYFYDRDVQTAIDQMQTLIGPIITVVVGVMLSTILVSLLGPIADLFGKIR